MQPRVSAHFFSSSPALSPILKLQKVANHIYATDSWASYLLSARHDLALSIDPRVNCSSQNRIAKIWTSHNIMHNITPSIIDYARMRSPELLPRCMSAHLRFLSCIHMFVGCSVTSIHTLKHAATQASTCTSTQANVRFSLCSEPHTRLY